MSQQLSARVTLDQKNGNIQGQPDNLKTLAQLMTQKTSHTLTDKEGAATREFDPIKMDSAKRPVRSGSQDEQSKRKLSSARYSSADADTSSLVHGDQLQFLHSCDEELEPLSSNSLCKSSMSTQMQKQRSSKPCSAKCQQCLLSKLFIGLAIGLFLLMAVLAYVIHYVALTTMRHRIREGLVLHNETSQDWRQPKTQSFLRVQLFDLLNPEDLLTTGHVLLNESQTLVYRVVAEKTDVRWNDNNTVSYRERLTFHFDRNLSSGSEDDSVTTVNIPLLASKTYLGPLHVFLDGSLDYGPATFQSLTAKQLLWGYQSDILDKLDSLRSWDIFHMFKDLDRMPTTFGFFQNINNSAGPMFNVYTGSSDFTRFNQIYTWNYQRSLHYWASDVANAIRGTDGSMFQPFLTAHSKLTMFCSQLFRAFELSFRKFSDFRGVDTLRFVIDDHQFSNATMIDEVSEETVDHNSTEEGKERMQNSTVGGFCVPSCMPNGVYSIEHFAKGTPLYISLPHFLGADPFYREQVTGLHPVDSKHRPMFDIDPVTGVTLRTRRRYQMNALLDDGLNKTVVPVFWVEVAADLDHENLSMIQTAHSVYRATIMVEKIVAGAAGMAFLFLTTIACVSLCRKHRTSPAVAPVPP